jgi:RimJ/RimL family protein N-acetyltransferase
MNIRECILRNLSTKSGLKYSPIVREDLEEVRILHNHPKVLSQLTNTIEVSSCEQEKWFVRLNQDNSAMRIVVRDVSRSSLVGVFRIDSIDNTNRTARIGLDVEPALHGQGFGKQIYTSMLDLLLIQCLIYRVYLETLSTNHIARGLYNSLGMVIEGKGRQALERPQGREDLVYYGLLAQEWRQRITSQSVDAN